MSLRIAIVFVLVSAAACGFIPKPIAPTTQPVRRSPYQEVDLEGIIRRHIAKDNNQTSIEGIYTVSCVITKKGKTLLALNGNERTVVRKDNYARVAIIKDWPDSNTEFVEISLSSKNASRYPIVAEINSLSEGGGFTYKHMEPKGEVLTFTFLYDKSKSDILEGVYTKTKNNVEVTYKLTYLKVYPKNNSFQSGQ